MEASSQVETMATLEDQTYEAKLQNLRRHAPFLKGMIDKLRAQERMQQVSKLESLWSMITSNKRLKFETLQKCEDVMLKIQSKSIAGVNKPDNSTNKSIKSNKPDKNVVVIMNAVKLNIARAKLHNEVTPTPKSPTPDRDLPQHIPITIPMDKVDIDEIASPDSDDDPTIGWNETSENRYDSARPDVYTNAVMHKVEAKPPTPIIPSVNINTPPISMQDLQQLEDSIPAVKGLDSESIKKEPSAEEKLLKRPSKVSLVPAPIIKPKHKNSCDTDKSKSKTDEPKKTSSKSSTESGKSKTTSSVDKEKEHKKSSESSSKQSSSKSKSSSHKSSHHSSDKPSSTKHSNNSSSSNSKDKDKDSKSKDNKSKSPRRGSTEDPTTSKDTIFGSLLSSIDNTLLTERDGNKKKVTLKPAAKSSCKPDKNSNSSVIGDQDKSTTVSDVAPKAPDNKPTEDKTVFKRLADKYNPRPKKKEPEVGQNIESIVSPRPETLIRNYPNKSTETITAKAPLLHTPANSLHQSMRFSPPIEAQFSQQTHQLNMQQRRPSFNPYEQMNPPMSPMVDFNQRSPMEYDLSKSGPADFYNNKSPPYMQNQRQHEPLMNRVIPPLSDAFPSWNSNREGGHDFQGRRLHPDHPRIDPRLSRQQQQQPPDMQPNNRFDGNFERQGDGNRFFRHEDSTFDNGNRFIRPNDNNFERQGEPNRFNRPEDNNFEGNRFLRPDNNDGNRFIRPNDNNFDRQGDCNNRFVRPDDGNRFGRPGENLDRPRDTNFPFRPNPNNLDRQGNNRFFRSNETNLDRPSDGNVFVRPGEIRDLVNRSANRFVKPDEKKPDVSKNDINFAVTVKDKPLPKKEEPKRVPKIEDVSKLDPRLQPKVKVETVSNPQLVKKEVYDEMYSKINCKLKDEHDSFTSPLDSIYEKKEKVTGKGYGVQKFRIPKKPRPPPPVAVCATPLPQPLPSTLPRKRSPSPPLRRPPTPPRKRRSPSPPEERLPTPPPPPKIIAEGKIERISDMPEIVAQLPESIRKDDRFGDVVNVLSSLLKDETALTKIKKLLTKGAKDSSSDDDDYSDRALANKQRKIKKLVKRQLKKQQVPAASKKTCTIKKSPSLSVDSTSTDTESTQIRRSGRLRKRVAIIDDDDDSEDASSTLVNKPTNLSTPSQTDDNEPTLTNEQLDDIASCIDPFDDFLPDNEADRLVEEALKQPAEKLEEEINKQLVNDIFDSLKNEDNILDVGTEDTQKIIDSWGLTDTNADKMIDSWDKKITEDLFDKDERDGDNSQDRQEDVRNEIDELIKNMPLNDSDKILDCDIVKENIVEPNVTESDNDEISKCDDVISSITKKLTEENSTLQKDNLVKNTDLSIIDQSTSETKPDEDRESNDVVKDSPELISQKVGLSRPLRSSPRVRPPVSYTDEVRPRAKRGSKKLDAESTSPKKQDDKVSPATDGLINVESIKNEPEIKESEPEQQKTDEREPIETDKNDLSTSEDVDQINPPSQEEAVVVKLAPSKEMIHLDLVITELIAKYSADNETAASEATTTSTKKVRKKPGPKPKCKLVPIVDVVKVKIEAEDVEEVDKSVDKIENVENQIKNTTAKTDTNKTTPKVECIEETPDQIGNETELLKKPITRNAKKQAKESESPENIEKRVIKTVEVDVEKSPSKKGKKRTTKSLIETSVGTLDKTTSADLVNEAKFVDTSESPTDKSSITNLEAVSATTVMDNSTSAIVSTVDKIPQKENIQVLIEQISPTEATLKEAQDVVKPPATLDSVSSDVNTLSQEANIDAGTSSTIETEAYTKDDSIETTSQTIEDFSEETIATGDSAVSKTVPKKKKVVVKKRGRHFKIRQNKKKLKPKLILESSATSEAGSTPDLTVIAPDTNASKKVNKPRRKRSELDKLHEDIKETMGDKVLISKRTCMKSPRGPEETDDTEKTEEDSEESDEDTPLKHTSKTLKSPALVRQKGKGSKVVVEELSVNKTAVLDKKAKPKQTQKNSANSEEDADSDSDDNESSTVLTPESIRNKQSVVRKRKKRQNAWQSGVIRSTKKRKINQDSSTLPDKASGEQNPGGDSDFSDDIDTDYDVEFVEPDAEHYMVKGKPTKCRLCEFEGTTLVDHYVNNHRAGEVPVARLCPEDSKLALEDSKENSSYANVVPQNLLVKDNKKKKLRFNFTCRFCMQEFVQFSNVQFADHIATHTGEYRHKCNTCDLKNASARFIKTHYTEVHEADDEKSGSKNAAPVEIIIPPPLNFHTVFGYMCSECNFVQLSYRSVTEHVQIYHLDESAAAIKINMSLQAKANKKQLATTTPVETMETGVFTSQEVIMEEELQREEEANRTELMKEVHKETTQATANRLSSVAALLQNRFDSSPPIADTQVDAALEQTITSNKEVVRLPKAKPKEPPPDIKPNLAELEQQQQGLTSELILPKPLSMKYTIFIIGPLKAVVTHSDRSVDFACITDDCVFYTTDRKDMAQHCRVAHDNICERIRCGYCTFVGNSVPLVQVFEHICGTHVDPLLVKEEPQEQRTVEEERNAQTADANVVEETQELNECTSPPNLPFMGNHFGIKIVSVAGGVLDDITPINEQDVQQATNSSSQLEQSASSKDTDADTPGDRRNNPLPQLLPINQQSASVLKKLSSLQKQMLAKPKVPSSDGIIVSKVVLKSNQPTVLSTTSNTSKTSSAKEVQDHYRRTILDTNVDDHYNRLINEDDAMTLTPNTKDTLHSNSNESTAQLISSDDNNSNDLDLDNPVVCDKEEHFVDPQHDLATLAKVSTLPEDSATATKRRFHTGKTDLLYRCPESKCGFASETRKEFELHLTSIGGGHSDLQRAYRCVYCYTTLPLAHYSVHLIFYHGTSEFGCSRCCYRGATPYHIHLHRTNYHQYDATEVLLLPLASDVPKTTVEDAMTRYTDNKMRSLIKPYSCYCGERFIVTANYSGHLQKKHGGDFLTHGVDCRDCQLKGGKNMVAHYAQVHNNHLYHCIYCSFGADVGAAEVFSHQSARHPGLPMEVIARALASGTQSFNLAKKTNHSEDENIWHRIVRLKNPQATKDLEIIKKLRENRPEKTSVTNSPNKTLRRSAQATSMEVTETIDLIVLSPDPSELTESNSNTSSNLTATNVESLNQVPQSYQLLPPKPTLNTTAPLSPRCVTPTNQPIHSPSLSSNMTTPDEDIFVVVQPSSDVPLAGSDLFVCAQCGIHCTSSGVFRLHVHDCIKVDREANTKPYGCAHCEKRSKTSTALLDHMRVHGFPRYRCGLCDFKHTQPWNVRTHMRSEHNISTCVQVAAHPNKLDDDFDDFIYRPRQSQLAPSALSITQSTSLSASLSNQTGQTNRDSNKDRKVSASSGGSGSSVDGSGGDSSSVCSEGFAVPVVKYLPADVDKLPWKAVYTSEVGCGLCGYTSKVRTNIARHLKMHVEGLAPTDLPTTACVNPVPCLDRDELMFDKMTNLAYNSHQADLNKSSSLTSSRMGGPAAATAVEPKSESKRSDKAGSNKGKATVDEESGGEVGPIYVPRSKRYVCGAVDCNYLCHDEIVFRRHIQALHSHSELSYKCRHCPSEKTSSTPSMMNVELVLRHLRLHGATLYKCAHCPFLHNMRSIIDRHMTERHLEKNVPNAKAIITVRDITEETGEDNSHSTSAAGHGDLSGSAGNLSSDSMGNIKPSAISMKDAKPWRCAMCKVRCVTVQDIVTHTTNKHKIGTRYKCGYCDYSNDDRDSYIPHFSIHHPDSPTPDIITIYFHSPSTQQQSTLNTSTSQSATKDLDSSFTNDSSDNDQLLSNFDTTPLWRKPSTGDVRHIRGILLETRGQHMQHKRGEHQGKEVAEKGVQKSGIKRELGRWMVGTGESVEEGIIGEAQDHSSGSPVKKQPKYNVQTAGIRSSKRITKSLPAPEIVQKQEEPRQLQVAEVFPTSSLVISVPVDMEISYHCDSRSSLRLVDVNSLSIKKLLIHGNLSGKFGEYGRPTSRGYMCPKCNAFETNGERQFLSHLFKEIGYMRYICDRCGTRSALPQTVYLRCPMAPVSSKPPLSDCVVKSHIDVPKEQWALMVLTVQTRIAAHITANNLWAAMRIDSSEIQGVDMSKAAIMKGLKLAYSIKGKFQPREIFPNSSPTRFSYVNQITPNDIQPIVKKNPIIAKNQSSPQSNNRYPRRNTTTTTPTTASIEDDLPVSVIHKDNLPPPSSPVQKVPLVHKMASNLTNIFAQGPSNPKQQGGAGKLKPSGNKELLKGIQMFPELVTIQGSKDGDGFSDDDDDDDDDDVEIIDPLVDFVDLDDACEVDSPSAASAAIKAKDPIPVVESVTVSSFLPVSTGEIDPLMDDTTYSDNDSIGLEIAEDEDIDEEVAPLHLQLSPNSSLNTSDTNAEQSPTKNTLATIPIKTSSLIIKSNDQSLIPPVSKQLEQAQDEVVSSTTSDNLANEKLSSPQSGAGIIATLTPIDSSLVGRLRVIGDASMVGCFGLSSGVGCLQLTAPLSQQQQQQVQNVAPLGGDVEMAAGTSLLKQQRVITKMLKCAYCTYSTHSSPSLKKHETRHWMEKPFRCGFIMPSGVNCDFQHHFRPNVTRHILDAHPGLSIPVIQVNITNPTIVGLRGAKSHLINPDQGSGNSGNNTDKGQASAAKRLRTIEGQDNIVVEGAEEEFVDRYTCPSCSYASHKSRYVQQHLRLHVKCIKCQLCNEKDALKKRLLEEKCVLHHENIPSHLVIEYDSNELDRLKGLIQKIRVPKSSVDQIQTPTADNNDEDENEFLEVYKTVRNYPKQPRKQLPHQKQQIQVIPTQRLTTFDVATSSYVPLGQRLQPLQTGDVMNTLYNVDNLTSGNDSYDGGGKDLTGAPIVLNTFLSQPR